MELRQNPTRVAIFASGTGSNAKKIIEYFRGNDQVEISLVISNRSQAGVLEIARNANIPGKVIPRQDFSNEEIVLDTMNEYQIDFIVLAGFLLLIPAFLIRNFNHRIVNIHPALLPKYGGKGMYGMHVHQAVKDAGDPESGITIHFVNEKYDEGAIIFQTKTQINPEDSPQVIAKKVLMLEHKYYPLVVEACIQLSQSSDEEE